MRLGARSRPVVDGRAHQPPRRRRHLVAGEALAIGTRRTLTRRVRIEFNASDRRTKRLLVAEQIAKRFDTRPLIEGLSLTLTPGMRLGILGPNGSGKTTLLRMLAGDGAVDSGSIE